MKRFDSFLTNYVFSSPACFCLLFEKFLIHLSTHDIQGQTRYYKWSYTETWEIVPQIMSQFVFDTEERLYRSRSDEENIYNCWVYGYSSEILLGNSIRLSNDIIAEQALVSIYEQDTRTGVLYCIQFAQMALTRKAYIYWENQRKNSEDIGGLFSPQPSTSSGNLYAINNPDEVVLGYISAGAQALSERKFIPSGLMKKPSHVDCDCEERYPLLQENDKATPFVYLSNSLVPVNYVAVNYSQDLEYLAWHTPRCCDCRELGGTKTRPIWWPSHHI